MRRADVESHTDNFFSDFCGRLKKDAVFETPRRGSDTSWEEECP